MPRHKASAIEVFGISSATDDPPRRDCLIDLYRLKGPILNIVRQDSLCGFPLIKTQRDLASWRDGLN